MDLWLELDSPYMVIYTFQKTGNESRAQAADFGVKHLHGIIRYVDP